jgi:hypothetical protein
MAPNLQIKNSTEVLRYAIKNGISIQSAQKKLRFHENYVSGTISTLPALLSAKEITRKETNQLTKLYEQAQQLSTPKSTRAVARAAQKALTPPVVEKTFDEYVNEGPLRVKGTWADPVRGEDGAILRYEYSIPVPGKSYKLKGELSREQLATIYSLYPYGTLAQMSSQFPHIPIEDLRRITRAFHVTKDTKYPPHILEERTEKEAAEFTLQAKAQRVTNKLSDYSLTLLEKQNRELQVELQKHKQTSEWAEKLLQKVLKQASEATIQAKTVEVLTPWGMAPKPQVNTYTFFSDIHFGKFFPTRKHMYGRGNDKDILRERCLRIAEETVTQAKLNRSKEVHLVCNGDLFESIIPDGMHPGHVSRMDMTGDEQVMFAIEVFEAMLATLVVNLPHVKISLHGIGGNHDRIQAKRDEDKGRTATLVFYKFLSHATKLRYPDRDDINIINYVEDEGIIRFAVNQENLSFIGHHGDAILAKRTPTELLNQFKIGDSRNFTIIFHGHYHSQKVLSEGVNYIHLQLGAVCSGDEYSQNNLGVGSQPSFIIGTRAPENAFGFDFTKFTLE